jgi:hypothetical protein
MLNIRLYFHTKNKNWVLFKKLVYHFGTGNLFPQGLQVYPFGANKFALPKGVVCAFTTDNYAIEYFYSIK